MNDDEDLRAKYLCGYRVDGDLLRPARVVVAKHG